MSDFQFPPGHRPSGPRTSIATKHANVGFPAPREHRAALIRLAAERNVSVSALMREALRRFLTEEAHHG